MKEQLEQLICLSEAEVLKSEAALSEAQGANAAFESAVSTSLTQAFEFTDRGWLGTARPKKDISGSTVVAALLHGLLTTRRSIYFAFVVVVCVRFRALKLCRALGS
jgi:hypothetical protein